MAKSKPKSMPKSKLKLSPFSRRDMLKAGGAAAMLAAGLPVLPEAAFGPGSALAKAAKKGTQVPGFYRFSLGAFEITVVSDGNLFLPSRLMASNVPEAELKAFLKGNYLDAARHMSHLNLALINTGKALILVDTGAGANFQDTAGKLVDNLEAAGHAPQEVDKVIVTHGHPDHVWGIIDDFEEAPRFPNATYVINKAEWDFWTAEDTADKLPEGFKSFASGARRNLLPVTARMRRVAPDYEVVPGVRVIDTAGHTPGHVSVIVESEGERLLITGDAVNHAYISFERPEWQPGVDMDKGKAVAVRKHLLDMAASEGLLVLGYHFPFPGLGHVARSGAAWRWVPALWQWEL